ncbi:DUF1016 N-terminal domain-containing protein [Glutamicibacter sp.]|uniref:DUF1016 N-terminal domain-containing protein n=1 Tax=Glutamicibacter sp. TaxID=1931995 RepID=UPI002B49A7CE|nr:DUF1016 N-terminal domain-containing protein [Glutamicibacter sp.]HJX79384.1 DUF1016 N-terminal domain-containing protein [Glutamicibacter sp.]
MSSKGCAPGRGRSRHIAPTFRRRRFPAFPARRVLHGHAVHALASLKNQIRQARFTAQRRVNTELITLYWGIGQQILIRQDRQGWGVGIIRRLADDLRAEFSHMKGFSKRNLQYMHTMANEWRPEAIVPQVVAQLPWGIFAPSSTRPRALRNAIGTRQLRSSTGGPATYC